MRLRSRVLAVAGATFREALRDRVLLVVVLFAVGLVLCSRALGWLSVEDELKMVQDFSLSGMSLLSLCLAMLVGAYSLAREVERRTAYTLLSRDLHRGEFILGKYLGLVAVFWLCLLGSGAVLALWISVWGGSPSLPMLAAVLGLLAETMVLCAVAMFFGAIVSPSLAAIGTLAFYIVGHSTEALRELTEMGKEMALAGTFGILYRVLPNLEDVNFINATTADRPVAWTALGLGTVAMLCWSAAFLWGATAMFRRREF